MHWEQRFRQQAAGQEGLVARFQLGDIGCTTDHWWQARRNGRWTVLSQHVVAAGGSPPSDAQRALAAVLDGSPGAILHGPSTLAWFGFRGYDLANLHVARARGVNGHLPELARLHRLRTIRAHDVMVARGVVTETPLRAIWTEADRYASPRLAGIGAERIGRLLDDGHRRRLVSWEALHEMVAGIRQRGRGGTVIMRALASVRTPGSSPTDSRMETRVEEVLEGAGMGGFRRQPVVGGHEPIGRCDLGDEVLPLVLEVNSLTFHTAPSDRANDERRHRRLIDAGFTVGVLWELDVWSHPSAVLSTVATARRQAAAGNTVVIHSPSCPWLPPVLGTVLRA
jgi:hypothetical protein